MAALMASACSENEVIGFMDEVKLSSSYVAIPVEGGENTITVEAKSDWKIDNIITKITTNKDGSVDTTWSQMPDWLTITPMEGKAGKTTRYGLFLPGCVRVPRYSRICSGVSSSTYARAAWKLPQPHVPR